MIFYPRETKMTGRIAAALIGVIWVTAALFFIPWLFVYGQQIVTVGQHEFLACQADWPLPVFERIFTVGVVFSTCYLLPLTVIVVFYLLIGIKVSNTLLFITTIVVIVIKCKVK